MNPVCKQAPAYVRMAVVSALGVAMVPASAVAEAPKLTIELNKLEAQDKSCRAYFVVGNETAVEYDGFKLVLVPFQPDGIVISKRISVNLAPLKPSKKTVKQFDFEGVGCDEIGSLLINDVTECKTAAGPVTDCLQGIAVTSLSKVQLLK